MTDDGNIVVLASGFIKKARKTPVNEIRIAERRRKYHQKRKK